ncbi:class I SAM-dependent methyltransferase [Mesorhizobium sp. M1365]|uniref:class I SAM-dependent methyltransferase n=1 Tax=Mesorhizobium sp. M1365 TaxID=2957090 RepID=UPI00333B2DC3
MAITNIEERLQYFASQVRRRWKNVSNECPNCKGLAYRTLDRKLVVIELRECMRCKLMYRFPADTNDDNYEFYQKQYSQGFTTDLPDKDTLTELCRSNFAGHEKSYAGLIELIERLGFGPGARIFDFGSSWGFGSWQFGHRGFDVKAYEISSMRAEFSKRELNVNCETDISILESSDELHGYFDIFFSNHVFEHIPSPRRAIQLARRLAKKGGVFIAVTPNGSLDFRSVAPRAWHHFWGKVHPNLISDLYWKTAFENDPYFIGGLPMEKREIDNWTLNGGQFLGDRSNAELLCVARLL